MTARLTSAMLVSLLVRRVGQEGGFAAVLARGDADAGAILLVCMEQGATIAVRERILGPGGAYIWQRVGPDADDQRQSWIDRRRARDPDLWIIELDIPNAERFADETLLTG